MSYLQQSEHQSTSTYTNLNPGPTNRRPDTTCVAPPQDGVDDRKAHWIRRLEANAADAEAWCRLGLCGGGVVRGKGFDATSCFAGCLELNEEHVGAWQFLADHGGGTVGGTFYNREACHRKYRELRGLN